jgi:hypothetical protein
MQLTWQSSRAVQRARKAATSHVSRSERVRRGVAEQLRSRPMSPTSGAGEIEAVICGAAGSRGPQAANSNRLVERTRSFMWRRMPES